MSAIKIIAETVTALNNESVPIFRTTYRLTEAVGNHADGVVETIATGLTETVFNLQIQSDVAARADLESSGLENFTAADVIGGRL